MKTNVTTLYSQHYSNLNESNIIDLERKLIEFKEQNNLIMTQIEDTEMKLKNIKKKYNFVFDRHNKILNTWLNTPIEDRLLIQNQCYEYQLNQLEQELNKFKEILAGKTIEADKLIQLSKEVSNKFLLQ